MSKHITVLHFSLKPIKVFLLSSNKFLVTFSDVQCICNSCCEIIGRDSLFYTKILATRCAIQEECNHDDALLLAVVTKHRILDFGMRTTVTLRQAVVKRSPPRLHGSHCLGVSQTARFTFIEASLAVSYIRVQRLIVSEEMAGFLALFCRTTCCGYSETQLVPGNSYSFMMSWKCPHSVYTRKAIVHSH